MGASAMTTRVWSIDIDGKPFIERQSGPRQFRCVFDVDIYPGDTLSFADIRLYGLAKTAVVSQRSRIVLRAGNDTREDAIFIGQVTNTFRERDVGSPNVSLRLLCRSGTAAKDRSSVQRSFGRGTAVIEVIRALADAWPIPLDINDDQFAGDQPLVSGFVVDGDIPSALESLAYAYGFAWVQELGRLVITKPTMARPNTVEREINQFSGMIGIPEVTRGPDGLGVFVSVSLDPFLKINGAIDIKSEFSTFNTGNLYIQELSGDATASGKYNILGIHHRGDSHGSQWASEIDGLRPGTVAQVASLAEGGLIWGQRVSEEFRAKVRQIAKSLRLDPNWLMAVMAFETGRTFSPSVKNPGSSATGLIQFVSNTAIGLGTTIAKLSRMTDIQQLDYVEKYFAQYNKRIAGLGDAYMAVLWPKAIGRPDSYVMWERDSGPYQAQYRANNKLDINNDGRITRGEAVSRVNEAYREGLQFVK